MSVCVREREREREGGRGGEREGGREREKERERERGDREREPAAPNSAKAEEPKGSVQMCTYIITLVDLAQCSCKRLNILE